MSVNKVQLANGETIIDISDSTVIPETLAEGATAYDASGQKITGRMVPGGGASVQSDWNQTDETAADFIKNKPFGDEVMELMPETEVVADENGEAYCDSMLFTGEEETIYVTFDGVEYTCDAFDSGMGFAAYGNKMIVGGANSGEPFVVFSVAGTCCWILFDSDPHTVSISCMGVNKLDQKYFDTQTVFYVNFSDRFLYIDAFCGTKATKNDVQRAVKNGAIQIVYPGWQQTLMPCAINFASGDFAFALVRYPTSIFNANVEDTLDAFFTAEYTGS